MHAAEYHLLPAHKLKVCVRHLSCRSSDERGLSMVMCSCRGIRP